MTAFSSGSKVICVCCNHRLEGMADIEPIATAIESTVSKKEQLQKAIEELDAHRDGIQNCTIQWKDLEQHFSCIQEALKKRVNELIEKRKIILGLGNSGNA